MQIFPDCLSPLTPLAIQTFCFSGSPVLRMYLDTSTAICIRSSASSACRLSRDWLSHTDAHEKRYWNPKLKMQKISI